MSHYIDLLAELGIPCDLNEWNALLKQEQDEEPDPTPPPSYQSIDPQPFWDQRGMKYYTSQQIDLFGEPTDTDWFYVLQDRQDIAPFALDYEQECLLQKPRPCHRYDRPLRFRFVLTYLTCQAGKIPAKIMAEIADEFGVKWEIKTRWYKYNFQMYQVQVFKALTTLEWNPDTIWEQIRLCLKRKGLKIYYNRITIVLEQLGVQGPRMNNKQFKQIMDDFTCFDLCFDLVKNETFCYFPHLRYIALRLMDKYGITCQYDIPILRTESKLQVLDAKFNKLHF